MTPPPVLVVNSDDGDWVGIYLNGRLAYEGHTISPERLLELLSVQHESHEILVEDRLPEKFEDLFVAEEA